ncbi:MAG: histidine kinase [Betaproteobacteria bacterium]|nr:histidine kinase [Betaproteobacteria bacterium]
MNEHSIRTRLLQNILVPLALTWLVSSLLVIALASHFAQKAFDRSLLDDAYLLASRVVLGLDKGGMKLELKLTSQDLGTVLFDQSESVFFAIYNEQGELVAGHPGLVSAHAAIERAPVFEDIYFQNKTMRSVILHRLQPLNFYVVVAQTTESQSDLLHSLLWVTGVPQIVLLVLLGLGLRRAIQKEIDPLLHLEQGILSRDVSDLSPLTDIRGSRDVRRLAEAFNDLLRRLKDGVRAQREFTGNVAHELRTPLAGIRALAEYGLQQEDPQQWHAQLQAIVKSEERATHLVDQLLALAYADEAEQGLPLQVLRLDTLVREVVIRYLPKAHAMGVDLGAEGLEEAIWVIGLPALIEGILVNLIDNALRHGQPADGSAACVTVALTLPVAPGHAIANTQAVLSVTDNGMGIAPSQQALVQARWQRADAQAAVKGGFGLGLSIIKAYAHLLKAPVQWLSGPSGSGLQVRLYLTKVTSPAHPVKVMPTLV